MYWIYIINNMYCIVDLRSNMIVAKFLYLDSAVKHMNYLKNQATSNLILNNLNHNHNCLQNYNNNIHNVNDNNFEDNDLLNHLNNELKKINKKLDSMSEYRKKQLEETFLLKPIYNNQNEVENLETVELTDTILNDDNLDVSHLNFEPMDKK